MISLLCFGRVHIFCLNIERSDNISPTIVRLIIAYIKANNNIL